MKGFIYKLINDDGDVYYGSTINVNRRIQQHKSDFNTCYSKKFNKNFIFEIIEEIEYDKIKDLRNRERYYIENNECINNNIPLQTNKEYREKNKNKINIIMSNWVNNNKEKFKSIQKKSYDKNGKNRNIKTQIICYCGGNYPKRNKKIHENTKKHIKFVKNNNV